MPSQLSARRRRRRVFCVDVLPVRFLGRNDSIRTHRFSCLCRCKFKTFSEPQKNWLWHPCELSWISPAKSHPQWRCSWSAWLVKQHCASTGHEITIMANLLTVKSRSAVSRYVTLTPGRESS